MARGQLREPPLGVDDPPAIPLQLVTEDVADPAQ